MKKTNSSFFVLVFVLFFACHDSSATFSGTYSGFWYETSFEYTFYKNQEFKLDIEGHFTTGSFPGTYERKGDTLLLMAQDSFLVDNGVLGLFYLIDGDSCIIDYDTTFDYCKTRDWSERRAVKYPQLPTEDSIAVAEIAYILQDVINRQMIAREYSDTSKELILEEYFQINKSFPYPLYRFGQEVAIKSKTEIEAMGIDTFLTISRINYNRGAASIELQMMPIWNVKGNLLGRLWLENGEWQQNIRD